VTVSRALTGILFNTGTLCIDSQQPSIIEIVFEFDRSQNRINISVIPWLTEVVFTGSRQDTILTCRKLL
jgi:hypothetical protein